MKKRDYWNHHVAQTRVSANVASYPLAETLFELNGWRRLRLSHTPELCSSRTLVPRGVVCEGCPAILREIPIRRGEDAISAKGAPNHARNK